MSTIKISARKKDLPKALKKDYTKYKREADKQTKEKNTPHYVIFCKDINRCSVLNIWDSRSIMLGKKYGDIKILYKGKEVDIL